MLQNTLNPRYVGRGQVPGGGGGAAVGGGGDSSGSQQDLEVACRLVDKHLNIDSMFASLLDRLRVAPQGPANASGLSESDYPSLGESRLAQRHLHTVRKVPLPTELLDHFSHMQCNCMMGLFPDIRRAWLIIDSDIFVWVYDDGTDLAYFDGLHDTILCVGLVKPKTGVFKPYIEYLLCLATTSEIVLLGVSFSQPSEGEVGPNMHLLPEPLFSVPSDGAYMLSVKGTEDGRIFLGGKDGCMYELVYQAEDGWFSRKCYKENHTKSMISYILPTFLTLSQDDPITKVEVDDSRHIAYTLSDQGTITVYDLGSDGKSTTKVISVSQSQIMNAALQVARTVDKSNFKTVVSVCPVNTSESPHVHLVVFTGTGVRLYYTTTTLNNPSQRPSQMTLLHVRLPPGFAANAVTHRPTKVHKALYSHGTAVLCASESNDADVVWTMSSDQYPYHMSLAESQAVLAVDGYVWALADVTTPLWSSALNPPTPQGTKPPLLVTQHEQEPKQLVLLSASGVHVLTALRPVDQLQHLLTEAGGAEGNAVKQFFSSMTPTQACATALILAIEYPCSRKPQVCEGAIRALFLYGTTAPSVVGGPFNPQTPTVQTFHPTQTSSPMPTAVVDPNIQVAQQGVGEVQFSPLHNAIYLFLSRILRPVWSTLLINEVKDEGNTSVVSIVNADEVYLISRQVNLLLNFLRGKDYFSPQPGSGVLSGGAPGDYTMETSGNSNLTERTSLVAACSLMQHTLEVLQLWFILITHNFNTIVSSLSKDEGAQLRTMTLRDLVISGREVCRSLLQGLLDRYHGDNASIDTISKRLLDQCRGLYSPEDAKLSKANEIILSAKNSNNKEEREKLFKEAVMLCKQIPHHMNVGAMCSQLAACGAYDGIVDLCLSVAAQRDPHGLALHFHKNNEPHDDHQGYIHFTSRLECYRVFVDQLNQLMGSTVVTPPSPSIPTRPGPPTPPAPTLPSTDANEYAEKIISLVVGSQDELAHTMVYQWLVDTGRTERLLAITSPFIEPFLSRSNGQPPLHHLLWRFYERNKDYYRAAKILVHLADQIGGDITLDVRVEYLSRALMCLSAREMTTLSSYSDFMLHLEEKKDVARVQLMVLDAIQGKSNEPGAADAIKQLNAGLLDITTLYEKFAEPWALWECKLAIVHCASHSETHLIQSLWTNIVDSELEKSVHNPVELRVDSLSNKIRSLARMYLSSPNFFPLEHLIRVCEIRSVRLRAEKSWVVSALQGCGIALTKLLDIYHKLYRSADSVWEVERAPHHLLAVLAHIIDTFAESPTAYPGLKKRAVREQCLDYIAEYLTDLGASADASAAIISSHMKSTQKKLERII
ncbi:nuclear pore complex protein Nup154 [Oratosquilla oratoria]|uniref:nuclear pore complex protein Nup154 n=1 Tax=Oratosquilla oratoria TaxID=337810 RepID=UPI003F77321E